MGRVVEVKNLSFKYKEELVLNKISLSVDKGDFLAFVGPNGSGKSTVMKLIIGDLKPDSGEVLLFGKNISAFKDWSRIAYMSQGVRGFNQSFPATVKEVVAANLYNEMGFLKILNRKLEKKVYTVLEMVDMYEYRNRKIGNLSGGQQQRVFIARTLVTEPELILLDEPMVGIDKASQDEFLKLINRLNRTANITVIMISHDIHMISGQVNKIVSFSNQSIFQHNTNKFDYNLYLENINNKMILTEYEHFSGGDYDA